MIAQIARKEIHHNLYSIRFPALLVISTILFIFNGILVITEPVQEIPKLEPNTASVTLSRQHDRLQFCARGTSADRIQKMLVRLGGNITPAGLDDPTQLPTGDRLGRFALPHADHMDWTFIIKIVFSLFAIIFTFDAICWEREQGTLTLMCANPISRSSVLLGKYLGAVGTLLMPLMVGVIINLLVIVAAGGILGSVSLQAEHWLRIGLLTLASMMNISLFALLGLLVSAAAQRSSSSLLILLAFWVALVIVLPNLAGIVSEHTSETESEYQLSRRRRQIWEPGGMGEMGMGEVQKQIESGKIKTQEQADEAAEEISTKILGIINDIESTHRDALVVKRRIARRIAMVSPAAIYQYTAEIIADSGFERQQRFLSSVRDYYRVYENYVREKVGKIVPACKWSFAMITTTEDGTNLTVSSPYPEQYSGDMSDFPYFNEPRWSIMDSLRTSLSNLGILFLWNILLFVTTHYIFAKRSLR